MCYSHLSDCHFLFFFFIYLFIYLFFFFFFFLLYCSWEGKYCEINIQDCKPDSCPNEGDICIDGVDRFRCHSESVSSSAGDMKVSFNNENPLYLQIGSPNSPQFIEARISFSEIFANGSSCGNLQFNDKDVFDKEDDHHTTDSRISNNETE